MVLGSRRVHSLTQLRRRDTHAECHLCVMLSMGRVRLVLSVPNGQGDSCRGSSFMGFVQGEVSWTHQAWIGQRMGVASTSWVKLGALWAPSLITTPSSRVKKHAPHHA
jgi:hypothetical protein